jgi:hypothetical protein
LELRIPVSAGELLDKISILSIKETRISQEAKLANVRKELRLLQGVAEGLPLEESQLARWLTALREVNESLWEIEDEIRACEARREFEENFISLARAVYRKNDERSRIKREINEATGSEIVEEKSYVDPK